MTTSGDRGGARARRRPGRLLISLGLVVAVAAALFAIAVLEGDLPADLTDVRVFARVALHRYGAAGSLALLYVEESGIPLPVPGDVYVAYLGRLASGDPLRWLGAWLGIITVVTGGASNLYLVSRRWGTVLLEHRLAALVDLDPERLASAERWFARYGAVAIIFGRHVPGLRIPVTLVAGVSRVSYPVFAASVAVSTAVWAAVWLYLGSRFGPELGRFFGHHAWTYALSVALIIGVVAAFVVRGWLRMRSGESRRRQRSD